VSSKYRLIVFDDKKEAFIPLTEFNHDQFIGPFFYWLKYKSYYKARKDSWDDDPEAVKEAVRIYLIEQMHCKIRGRDGHEGVYLTSKSSKTVQLFLSAIKVFISHNSLKEVYTGQSTNRFDRRIPYKK